jgi:RNA polymerase sigma-70 factor (ECF subfamily)
LPRLRQWASGRLPNYARDLVDTEDLVQDAFVRTLSRLERLDPKRNEAVLAYFRRAVMNRMRDEIRRPHRVDPSVKDPEDIPHQGASPLEIVIGRETVDRFEAAFSRLSTIDRELVMARIELHLTYQEIADLTGKPSPDAARVAVGRALVFLAQEMAQEA